jgi:hypothetical protein
LLDAQTQRLIAMGMGTDEAESMASHMLDQCIAEAKAAGTYDHAPGMGDLLVGVREPQDEKTRQWVETTRADLVATREEGATSEDIQHWWNLPDIEARLAIADNNNARMAFINWQLAEGLAPGSTATGIMRSAIANMKRIFPAYRRSDVPADDPSDDRPLPCELKDRVDRYIARRSHEEPDAYKRDRDTSSSLNALVRREIHAQNL